jgi:hypothetical protein
MMWRLSLIDSPLLFAGTGFGQPRFLLIQENTSGGGAGPGVEVQGYVFLTWRLVETVLSKSRIVVQELLSLYLALPIETPSIPSTSNATPSPCRGAHCRCLVLGARLTILPSTHEKLPMV